MKTLRLEVETLAVESFTAGERAELRGTIGGNGLRPTLKTVCDQTLLGTNPTCCPCTP